MNKILVLQTSTNGSVIFTSMLGALELPEEMFEIFSSPEKCLEQIKHGQPQTLILGTFNDSAQRASEFVAVARMKNPDLYVVSHASRQDIRIRGCDADIPKDEMAEYKTRFQQAIDQHKLRTAQA